MTTKITSITPKIAMKARIPPAANILPKFLGAGVVIGLGVGDSSSPMPGVGAGPSRVSNRPTEPCIMTGPCGLLVPSSSSFVTYRL